MSDLKMQKRAQPASNRAALPESHVVPGVALRRFLVFTCFLLVFALTRPVLAQGSSPSKADVVGALRRGDNTGAIALAERALQRTPDDCSLLSLEGVAQSALADASGALRSFQSALTHCPAYLPALEGAAQIEVAQHGNDAAQLLERILVIQPDNPTANAMLASVLHDGHRCREALPHFRSSQVLFSSRPDLQQGYGSCLADEGDLNAALVSYLQLLAARPNDMVRFDVALLQWKTHAVADALATLEPLLTGTHHVPALALASKLHEERGETPEAVRLLREAILEAPDEVDNYLDFAAISYAHSSCQVGIDVVNAGLKRLPTSAPLLVARGVLEVQLSHNDAAFQDFSEAHRLDPKLSLATDAIGILHSQEHLSAESLALFETQASLHTDDPLVQYLLAEQLAEGGAHDDPAQLNRAIAAAQRAVALDRSYRAAHDLLAILYVRAKQPQLAIGEAEAALALDPDDQEALFQEILSQRTFGDKERVRALTARLNQARQANQEKQERSGRYSLQEPTP